MEDGTLEVVIETPSRDYQAYAYDYQTQALRLTDTVYLGQRLAGDLAIIPETLTTQGRPLNVLVITNLANAPGVRVDVRPIGLVCVHDGNNSEEIIIALPKADETFQHVTSIDELASMRRTDIERFFATSGLAEGELPRMVTWHGMREADRAIHEARRAAKIAKAQRPKTAGMPAWKPATREEQAREGHAIHTLAELSLFSLPPRFQEYVGDLLLPNERILYCLARDPLRVSGTQEREGVFVITDQQVLWMTDAITPHFSMVGYGYVGKVGVHERLEAVRASVDALYPQLMLTWRARAGGSETLTITFHPEQSAEVQRLAEFLTRFLPPYNLRRVRRVFVPGLDEKCGAPYEYASDMPNAPEVLERLRADLKPLLTPAEWIRAEALAIDFDSRAATLLSVTNQCALIVSDTEQPQRIDFARIITMELGSSVMGPWLSISLTEGKRIHQARIEIPLIAFAPFHRCFMAMRQALLTQSIVI